LWSALVEVMPGMGDHLEVVKANIEKWETYEEDEKDKAFYIRK